MAAALSSLGYIAELLAPEDNRSLFKAQVLAYLRSGLPVILLISKKQVTGTGGKVLSQHAVTITGYSEPKQTADLLPSDRGYAAMSVRTKSAALDVIYVHDDNLGSHAHYELFDSDEVDDQGHKKLMLRRGSASHPVVPWWEVDEWDVLCAMVPKPDKLRMPMSNLLGDMFYIKPWIERVLNGLSAHYSVRVEPGVDYKRSLFDLPVDHAQLRVFQQSFMLPRHVGVISALDDQDRLLCDVVIDVSEIHRRPYSPAILGIVAPVVPMLSRSHRILQVILRHVELPLCPIITGPAATQQQVVPVPAKTTDSTVTESTSAVDALPVADEPPTAGDAPVADEPPTAGDAPAATA
jgi:hypothetical protein